MDTKVTIFEDEQYHGDWFPENGLQLIEWLKRKIDEAPEEFRSKVKVEMTSHISCHSSCICIDIFYYRAETKIEKEIREARLKTVLRKRNDEERKELARLTKKFSDGE